MGCQKLIYKPELSIYSSKKLRKKNEMYIYNYRFTFNGKESDGEVSGEGNTIDFGARIYDSRIGRFFKLDAYKGSFPSISPYSYTDNKPIRFIDYEGNFIFDPFFAKRYPNVARIIAYQLPHLAQNPFVVEAWIKATGITDHTKGVEAFNNMVKNGQGPFITPTRDMKECNLRGYNNLGGLTNFYENPGEIGEGGIYDEHGHKDNLAIGFGYFQAIEDALNKNVSQKELSYLVFKLVIVIMHESTHYGAAQFGSGTCPDTRCEEGAKFEAYFSGQRFSYRELNKDKNSSEQSFKDDIARNYWFKNNTSDWQGGNVKGLSFSPKYYWSQNIFKNNLKKPLPSSKNQKRDPTLVENGDVRENTYQDKPKGRFKD